jgi:hypothetical protein
VAGCAIAFYGILRGNSAADSIFNEVDAKNRSERSMFATGEEIDAGGYKAQRARAIDQYRAAQPNGYKLHSVQVGQVLTVVGMLVAGAGAFFK